MGEIIRLLFWRAAHERERPNFPLYHTIRNLSIGKVHKEINNLFPEKGLTFAVISCIIRYTPKEGNTSRLKKVFEKFKKTLDKLPDLWYNKYIKTRTVLKTRKGLILWKTRK